MLYFLGFLGVAVKPVASVIVSFGVTLIKIRETRRQRLEDRAIQIEQHSQATNLNELQAQVYSAQLRVLQSTPPQAATSSAHTSPTAAPAAEGSTSGGRG